MAFGLAITATLACGDSEPRLPSIIGFSSARSTVPAWTKDVDGVAVAGLPVHVYRATKMRHVAATIPGPDDGFRIEPDYLQRAKLLVVACDDPTSCLLEFTGSTAGVAQFTVKQGPVPAAALRDLTQVRPVQVRSLAITDTRVEFHAPSGELLATAPI